MDTDNINFNELWTAQKTGQSSTKDLFLKMNNFKKSSRKKIIITNIILVATAVFILFVWLYFQPQWVTTKIGIILIIVAIAFFVISTNKSLTLFKATDETESNQQYLKSLLVIKQKQQFIQTTMLNIYFMLLSTGIALYMYEYIFRMTIFWAVFSYGITGLWILYNWLYLRPKQIKKQQAKLNEIISKFEKFQSQLRDVDI